MLIKKCQKEFEYKYIYNMPEKKPISWEQIKLGSFIHKILEEGVKSNFKTVKKFIDLSHLLYRDDKWKDVNLDEANHLIQVFYQRNKNKFNENSKTEIVQNNNCVFIHGSAENLIKLTDQFLFKIMGIK